MYTHFPCTKYGGSEKIHKSGNCSYPCVKKHSTADFQSIQQKNLKNKNADARVWGDARRDPKSETFLAL